MGLKQRIHKGYQDLKLIEVEAPEWLDENGKPSKVRFRAALSVDDVHTIGVLDSRNLNVLHVELFALLAVDEEGKKLVDPNDDEWFRRYSNGLEVVNVAKRANLIDVVTSAMEKVEEPNAGN